MADLGGRDAISTQQAAIVDLAVKARLLLDSIDAWLLVQPSLINLRKRALLPVVRERQQLADALARCPTQLGLERRERPPMSLADYLAQRATAESPGVADGQEGSDGAVDDDVREPDEEWWLPRRQECIACDRIFVLSVIRARCPSCGLDNMEVARE